MTTGEIIFYSGLGLMVITAVLAIIFWFVKPQYKPENTAYEGGSPGTQRLRSGYPTDRLTVRQDPPTPASMRFTGTAAVPPQPGTVPLRNAAAPTEKTAPTPGTVPLMNDGTAVLQGTAQAAGTAAPKATAPLEASAPAPAPAPNGRQEDQGGTTLL